MRGFSLVELLVVIAVMSLLMAILAPALGSARRQAQRMIGMTRQKQITAALNLFAFDNDDFYPQSVATVGFGTNWNWSAPTKLAANRTRSLALHRSVSAYLRAYIPDADTIHCPSAPKKYKYLQQAWDAGEEWDNPNTDFPADPVGGTLSLFWNYTGYIGGRKVTIKGPLGPARGHQRTNLLVADYFGYDHRRSPGAYGSCEKFAGANVTPETWLSSAYWSKTADANAPRPEIKLKAGYIDGHVESYSASEAVPMKISMRADGTLPYPDGVGDGTFFLPPNALH